tara:strand:+ start:496 stop:873 length:378 start_codon:yes stop_codon:yes gene_type:complete
MIGLIVNGLSKAVGGYFEHSAKKAKANSDLKIAEIDAKTAVQKKIVEGKVDWEKTMAQASDDSWKDEAWTVCFIAIILFSFIPYFQPFVSNGIQFLSTFPEWLQWSIMASIGASFGLKSIGKFTK